MNLRQLHYFTTIAQLEHYTRASEKLFVSQSSLSHAISELEKELGVKLFIRQGRNVKLTKYGEVFYPHAKKTLETLENGVSTLREFIDPDRGTVVLSAFSSLDPFVSDAIVQYISQTHRVDVRFQYEHDGFHQLRQKLLEGEIDLAISTQMDDPRLEGVKIGQHPLVLLVPESHPFAAQESVSLQQLTGENFAAFDAESQLGIQIKAYFDSRGVRPNVVMQARQDEVIYGLVASAHAVAITPLPLHNPPSNVKVLPISDALPTRDLYLLWNKERYLPPAAGCFKDFIAEKESLFSQYLLRCATYKAINKDVNNTPN